MSTSYAAEVWNLVQRVRAQSPLVHNITNYVAMDVSANVLLAAGASPAMVHANEEVEEFMGISDALVTNIGTLSPPWVEAMLRASDRARALGKPWVLDPVGAGATQYRTGVARELTELRPTVLRGNGSEILAVHGAGLNTRGVDSTVASGDALGAARALAAQLQIVVAVTGKTDYVTDGARTLAVHNGHAMMTRVTALGCSLSALVAAFAAVHGDRVLATAAALAAFGLAGERAARESAGPGTFRQRIVDELYLLDESTTVGGAVVEDV
ncbi:MAG TPA: hydroxyethylthiazole kinase [Longimicrobium sp.]|nr:hydroxyethylthiazole kinase [Longimicrobium sp.]